MSRSGDRRMGIYSLVDSRADNSLYVVTNTFNNYYSITNRTYNNIELKDEQLNLYKLYTSYKIINKWMGRIYIFGIRGVINCPTGCNDFTISLKYKGKMRDKNPLFQSQDNASLADRLNKDKELIEICKTIDFEKLVIKYLEKHKHWEIEMMPNFGDFIWMLIPPLRYMRRPNNVEIESINKLMRKMSNIAKSFEG